MNLFFLSTYLLYTRSIDVFQARWFTAGPRDHHHHPSTKSEEIGFGTGHASEGYMWHTTDLHLTSTSSMTERL
ncbi:hypothetical protein BC941DRAFT_423695 [Chlamydoabsidia padenii]|nr:hypothetical protein BC941DRAFT_423695 [Chlamydoabsidia padenii]